jgi:hypothetical protein
VLSDLLSETVRTTGEMPSGSPYARSGRIIRKHHFRKPRLNHLGRSRSNLPKCRMTHLLHSLRALRLRFLQCDPRSRELLHLDLYPIQQHTLLAQIAPTVTFQAILLLLQYSLYHTDQPTTQLPRR